MASGQPRRFALALEAGTRLVSVHPDHEIHDLLDQCPSIEVWCDEPAARLGFFFTISDGANVEQVTRDIAALRTALDRDFLTLKQTLPEPPIPHGQTRAR
jgi:hypothetical protein